jgi:molybdopterin/thiamine biosynthesis adenylyltransferase
MLKKYSRQYDLIPQELLKEPIHLIGAGGIGSWSALCLTKMGCTNLTVQDMDKVALVNTASQLYGEGDIGKPKVTALAEIINNLSNLQITPLDQKWTPEQVLKAPIVISGLDSMETRRQVWDKVRKNTDIRWYIDGRMQGDLIRIYGVDLTDTEKMAAYEKTLVMGEDSEPVACTSKAVIYNTFICGGVITNLVKKAIRGEVVRFETIVDLVNLMII